MKALGWFCLVLFAVSVTAQSRRPIAISDIDKLLDVADPRVSPDGAWVAYTVSSADIEADTRDTDIWMSSWDATRRIRATSSKEAETAPRWSPDGKWLAFLSARGAKEKGTQVWLLPRAGGEAEQLTKIDGTISDYAWSPDSKRIAIVRGPLDEPPAKPGEKPKTPKPIVLDRYHFKQDKIGYLHKETSRIWIFDIAAKTCERLTTENFEESSPAWRDDGASIAFFSDRAGDGGRYSDWQLAVAASKPGSDVRVVTSGINVSKQSGPAWSKDGSNLFFLSGRERKYSAYDRLSVTSVPASGGTARILTPGRATSGLMRFSSGLMGFLSEDDRVIWPARIQTSGSVQRMLETPSFARALDEASGHTAVLVSTAGAPAEVYALENGALRSLSKQNDGWLSEVTLGETRAVDFETPDKVRAGAMLTLPRGQRSKLPLIVWIHGGPNGQDGHDFDFERELFAANGFAVLAVNYRGSSGRDEAFQTAIFADWGNKEVVDLLAGTSAMIERGIADPARLGIGGWSYGGILTDYTIATDTRFKAAISGAGSALQLSMYGSDQYVEQYDLEMGLPWKSKDLWLKVSYPFFHANRIRTPTLFLCGEKDFNVPVIGSEQMYQALKANGIDTQLIIYPGQFHGITKPSYAKDRLERYVAWYKKYLAGS